MKNLDKIRTLLSAGNKMAFWGASRDNAVLIKALSKYDYSPCAIIDNDQSKQGKSFLGIPIMSYNEVVNAWPEIYICIAEAFWKYQVMHQLEYDLKFPKERIINYEPTIKKNSCPFVESALVCFSREISWCCSDYGKNNPPKVELKTSYGRMIDEWCNYRERISEKLNSDEKTECSECSMVTEGYYPQNFKINMINYSSGGICNLRCIYCDSIAKRSEGTWEADIDFEKLLSILKEKKLLSDNYHLDYAPGEPSLHKYKARYYSLFSKAGSVTVMTNATVFDEKLAECLYNGNTNLLISLDAGIRETYCKVHGRDWFEKTINNIKMYNNYGEGCIDLKYIFVPGVNDTPKDISGFIEICELICPGSVFISYDFNNPVQTLTKETLNAVKLLIKELEEKNFVWKNMSDVIAKDLEKVTEGEGV